jgi:hypothetical protein
MNARRIKNGPVGAISNISLESALVVSMQLSALFPLTLTLSLRERENHSTGRDRLPVGDQVPALADGLPLPKGEGRGEGEGGLQLN